MDYSAANSRLSQKAWYVPSIFDVSGGGNLSTDSLVRRQKRFQSALRKFQRFTRSLWVGTLNFVGVMEKADVVTSGNFLGHVCPAVGCPGGNSRRPGLG